MIFKRRRKDTLLTFSARDFSSCKWLSRSFSVLSSDTRSFLRFLIASSAFVYLFKPIPITQH